MQNTVDWWKYVRDEELKPLLDFLHGKKHFKNLKIGGGNGYQASKISKLGHDITSIDIFPAKPSYFNVEKMDVGKLPYASNSFDLVFTSVTLQHIKDIDSAFLEMNRVLKDDGFMIHIVPTSWWTIFTNFWHYYYIPKFLLNSFLKKFKSKSDIDRQIKKQNTNMLSNKASSKLKLLFFNPLGHNPSFIHEIFYFRKNNWKKILERYSLEIIDIKNCPISSTGYGVFQNKLLQSRKFFASHYFPTIICIIVKKL